MNVLVLQHIACEPPGIFEDVLLERGAVLRQVELDEGEPLPPSLDGVDAIVAMGGPVSVNDEAMADAWARVPEYVASADRVLGPGGLDRLLVDFRASMDVMQEDGRTLFSRWVDLWA